MELTSSKFPIKILLFNFVFNIYFLVLKKGDLFCVVIIIEYASVDWLIGNSQYIPGGWTMPRAVNLNNVLTHNVRNS